MFNLIKHLPNDWHVEAYIRKQVYKDVQTLLSKWKQGERKRQTERQREMMQFIMMVLNVPFLEICHFILNPFLLLLSKDSEAIGECY